MAKIEINEQQLREQLTEDQFRICREAGTEPAFSGEYWDCKTPGIYNCRCCGEPLFSSDTKYDSGSGWPSFYQPVNNISVAEKADHSYGMTRIEIICATCDTHLGHVFTDGPQPTGLRYCVNSASIKLEEKAE